MTNRKPFKWIIYHCRLTIKRRVVRYLEGANYILILPPLLYSIRLLQVLFNSISPRPISRIYNSYSHHSTRISIGNRTVVTIETRWMHLSRSILRLAPPYMGEILLIVAINSWYQTSLPQKVEISSCLQLRFSCNKMAIMQLVPSGTISTQKLLTQIQPIRSTLLTILQTMIHRPNNIEASPKLANQSSRTIKTNYCNK